MIESLFDAKLTQKHKLAVTLLTAAVQRDRLANAYLLTGASLDDKWVLARQLCCFLNCTHLEGPAKMEQGSCHLLFAAVEAMSGVEKAHAQYCQNCRWISEDQHPQAWLPLISGTKSGKIPVEKARALSAELAKSSRYIRMAVIENANEDIFHRPAANALLKTIEDPKDGCMFMLFAQRVEDVLPTIVSRCQVIPMPGMESDKLSVLDKELPPAAQSIKSLTNAHRLEGALHIQALDLALELQTMMHDGEVDADTAIDAAVAVELKRLGQRSLSSSEASQYLRDLVQLSESAKEHIDHYVSPKAAVESFALSWWQLRTKIKV